MGRKKVEKSRIEKGIKKEEKTFALMAKKIVDAIKDEKLLREFTRGCLEELYKDNPKLFADHSKLKLIKK
ncbi:MAG: hypothetical protein EBR82_83695 [Caulobacteraceae bacterium]|nr:hypothetical protein [Caulobacteraceae bacterium]